MKVTTIIFTYGKAEEVVKRHLPIWKEYTDELMIVSPTNNPCIIENIDCLTHSESQKLGHYSLSRQLFAMKAALGYNSDFYVFLEYDALMLKRPEPRPIIQGNLFNERVFFERQEEWMQKGHCFLHFPWIFPADKLKEFVDRVELDSNDESVQDKWLIQKLMDLNMEVHNLFCSDYTAPGVSIEGYSQNSLDTPERVSYALNCVKRGAYALHGIKTEKVFNEIIRARNIYISKPIKIFTYYDNINFQKQDELIELWKESWERKGFDVTVLTPAHALKSSFYNEFVNGIKYIHIAITGKEISKYGLSCYLRWLAYSTQNVAESFFASDYDVINKDFTPQDVTSLNYDRLSFLDGNCPCLAYGTTEQYLMFCKDIVNISLTNKETLKLNYKDVQHGCYHDQEYLSLNSEREKYNICRDLHKYVTLYIKEDVSSHNAKTLHVAHRSIRESKDKFFNLKDIDTDVLRVQFVKEILTESKEL